jgi:peptidoglycan/xylan/chitin deacetylase (PgdA/CDA1 family)
VKFKLIGMPALAVVIVLLAWVGGISLRTPASWSGAADQVLPDPVKPRPAPKLPPVDTAPLDLDAGRTVVSITFDDGRASNALAAEILAKHHLAGTFFLNSGNIGKPGYLTLDQVDTMAIAGQEIAGHTVNHPYLAALPHDEQVRQICGDRNTWLAWGFPVRNFAYPFSSYGPDTKQIVHDCGYNSGRSLGLAATVHAPEDADESYRQDCVVAKKCQWAEGVPPADPYYTLAPAQVRSNWTVEEMMTQVTEVTDPDGSAYSGDGGWVQFTWHGVCPTDCMDIATSADQFDAFVGWLENQQKLGKFLVRTVGEVIGGPVRPAVAAPPSQPSLVNGDLRDGQDGQVPCWLQSHYGANKAGFSDATGPDGKPAERVVVTDYHDGDAGLLSGQDLGMCSVAVQPGDRPTVSTRYRSTVPARFVIHYRTARGNWSYSTSGPAQPASPVDWASTTWTVPPAPKEATAISFGLVIEQNGEITTADYGLRR